MNDNNGILSMLIKLNNEYSQILYLIAYLYENAQINYEQKIELKKLVLLNSKNIFSALKELKSSQNMEKFCENLMNLIPNLSDKENQSANLSQNKAKHLISISSNSWNEEITKDDNNNIDYQ